MWGHHHHHHYGFGGGGGWGYRPHYHSGWGGGGMAPLWFLGGAAMGAAATSSVPVQSNNYYLPPAAAPPPPSTTSTTTTTYVYNNNTAPPPTASLPRPQSYDNSDVYDLVNVVVPAGVRGGETFRVEYRDSKFNVTCPVDAFEGQTIQVRVPNHAVLGTKLLQRAYESAPPPSTSSAKASPPPPPPALRAYGEESSPARPPRAAVVLRDHVVAEEDAQFSAHQIISVHKDDVVAVLEGDPVGGLPPPYEEYVKIRREDGKSGRVSKFVLRMID